MKTKKEIEQLKEEWKRDPIWDIEETEGFEEHRSELIKFRVKQEAAWENKSKENYQKRIWDFLLRNKIAEEKMGMLFLNNNGLMEYLYRLHLQW